MNFEFTDKSKALQKQLAEFMDVNIYPHEKSYRSFVNDNLWQHYPELENLKAKAKAAGLWNLFLPKEYGDFSPGLSNLEYAPLAEQMGRIMVF